MAYRKFGEDRKYPIRQVLQIIRIKRADGTEWLKSIGRLVHLDKAGNEVEHFFTDSEVIYKPLTQLEFKRKDPMNENSSYEKSVLMLVLIHILMNILNTRYHLTQRTLTKTK